MKRLLAILLLGAGLTSLATITKMAGVSINAITKIDGAARSRACGVYITGGDGYPTEYHTNFVTWASDARWIYDPLKPFTSDMNFHRKVHIEAGTGWTTNTYTVSNYLTSYATGTGDGTQNMAYLSSAPATAATRGGIGWVVGEYGTNHFIFDGNSITAGDSTAESPSPAAQDQDYPQQVIVLMTNDWNRKFNVAVSGYTTSNNITHFTNVSNAYNATKNKNVLTEWEGSNSMAVGGLNSDVAVAHLSNYCGMARALGTIKIIVLSVLPRSDVSAPGNFETNRLAYNTILRGLFTNNVGTRIYAATGVTWADYMIDVASNTTIGDSGDELNTTYYSTDKVHLKIAGCALIAADVKACFDLLP